MYKTLIEEDPGIAAEWDFEKNNGIRPDEFTAGSGKKVWWKCNFGHSWYTSINIRYRQGSGCPYCAGKKTWPGFNDLKTTHPHIASQWDYEKNGELQPEQVSIGADIKIWWKCEHGHSWQSVLHSCKKNSCPYCTGRIVTPGINDLRTLKPHLASEWDSCLNGGDMPNTLAPNNNRKVWWKCKLGHSWHTHVYARNVGKGCPYCACRKLLPGFNDLLSVAPELAVEWHCGKNGELRPENVFAGSNKNVWWICRYGHEWQTRISKRRIGRGCPYCAGQRVITGETDLKTCHPILCGEWDYHKNEQTTPDTVACHSHKHYWWKCSKGHSYQASANHRVRGSGCPYCAGQRPITGVNDLGTLHPLLVCEWDFDKNMLLRPEALSSGSCRSVWWRCENGHSWKAVIHDRVIGRKCPFCSGVLAIPGETDFGAVLPELTVEWDTDRNEGLAPENFKPYSNKAVWWRCKNDHRWMSTVGARFSGSGCPYCRGRVQMRTRLVL